MMTTTDKRTLLYTIAGSLCIGLLMLSRLEWNGRAILVGDQPYYHTMGVNLARGYGFQCTGFVGDPEEYRHFFQKTERERLATGFKIMTLEGNKECATPYGARSPGFPVLLGAIYALGGWVETAQSVQAGMIILTMTLLPLLGYAWWKRTGAVAGVIAGAVYGWFTMPLARHLLTEPLTALWLTITLLCMHAWKPTQRLRTQFTLGLLLGSAVLVKDTLTPFMVLMTIALGIRAWKAGALRRWYTFAFAAFLPALLWSAYLSIGNAKLMIISQQLPMAIRAGYNPLSQENGTFAPDGIEMVSGYSLSEAPLLPVIRSAAHFAKHNALHFPLTVARRWEAGLYLYQALALIIILLALAAEATGIARPRGAYRLPADGLVALAGFAMLTTFIFGLPRHWQTTEPVLFLGAANVIVALVYGAAKHRKELSIFRRT